MLICASANNLPLADESVQCVVTSPPYWGLRKYAGEQELIWGGEVNCKHEFSSASRKIATGGTSEKQSTNRGQTGDGYETGDAFCLWCGAWRGAYGLEPTVEMYVEHTVEILREIRRVLRKDGVVFWNIGDSYCSTDKWGGGVGGNTGKQTVANGIVPAWEAVRERKIPSLGLKPKDLCLIPFRVALAAQADGWWVRSVIIWNKPNPMPESVTDRPTDAYEHILMLTKSGRYFWDADAVREPHARLWDESNGGSIVTGRGVGQGSAMGDLSSHPKGYPLPNPLGRNVRNVWTFPTQPYKGAHFATFPEELPRRCILAATSARGACRFCGAPWERVIHRTAAISKECPKTIEAHPARGGTGLPVGTIGKSGSGRIEGKSEMVGWRPTCTCKWQRGETTPCVVLDPFGGSGTTGRVAIELKRTPILIDLAYNGLYGELAAERTSKVQVEMFA